MVGESELSGELVSRFGAQVIILYGSAARGQTRPGSDIDVVCFAEGDARYPESYLWQGLLVDAWLHPLSDAQNTEQFLKLHDGRALLDRNGVGQALLERVAQQLGERRAPLEPKVESHRRTWLWKMFDRAAQSGARADHRRHWLLYDLPETWCDLTQRHYLGADLALQTMQAEAPQVHQALVRALAPGATIAEIEQAVEAIVGPRR